MSSIAISNPQKEVQVNSSIETVRKGIKNIPTVAKGAKLIIENDFMGFYQFEIVGNSIFSVGVFLELSIHRVSETMCEIKFECRRKIGWIDDGMEASECYKTITDCIRILTKLITDSQ